MRKGIVRIPKFILQDALGFPSDWNIEEIVLVGDVFTVVISGEDFPIVTQIKEVDIIFHKAERRAEIKEKINQEDNFGRQNNQTELS
jgi:hypothetical protein